MNGSTTINVQIGARKAVVIGAGPVGCLTAISLSKMGWQVEVYEGRSGKLACSSHVPFLLIKLLDVRVSNPAERLRSINLAISHRGITALRAIDPEVTDRFLKTIIPVHARMIHYVDGGLTSQPYDRDGQVSHLCGYSASSLFNIFTGNQFRRSCTPQCTTRGGGHPCAERPVLL